MINVFPRHSGSAGNMKFAASQKQLLLLIHSTLFKTRLYRGKAILEILYSRLKNFCGDSRK